MKMKYGTDTIIITNNIESILNTSEKLQDIPACTRTSNDEKIKYKETLVFDRSTRYKNLERTKCF